MISTSLKDFKIICSFTWVFAGSVVGIGKGVKLRWPCLLCMFRHVHHQTLNEAIVWCAWHLKHVDCIYYVPAVMRIVGKIEVQM